MGAELFLSYISDYLSVYLCMRLRVYASDLPPPVKVRAGDSLADVDAVLGECTSGLELFVVVVGIVFDAGE